MAYLVTGVFGFSGSYVAKELLRRGEEVIGTDLPRSLEDPHLRLIAESIGFDLKHPNLTLVGADLLDAASLEPLAAMRPERIFHTASLYDYSASLETLRRINVEGTRNLLAAIKGRHPKRFIHWSTCGVFGKPYTAKDGAKANIPFTEESSSPKNTPRGSQGPAGTRLVNPYSISKWEQEKMMWEAYEDDGLPLTVVRPAPIYGPGSSYGHGGIVLTIAHGLLPAIPLDSKNYITASVHVEDIARFAIEASDNEDTLGEDYNVVDNSIISYHDFLDYIALLTGRRLRKIPGLKMTQLRPLFGVAASTWTWLQRHFGIPRVRVFEIQSTSYVSSSYWLGNRKTLGTGFEYRYADVKEGLKDTVAWFRDMGWFASKDILFVKGDATGKG
jgi:dihydroflavonol-4-reductase